MLKYSKIKQKYGAKMDLTQFNTFSNVEKYSVIASKFSNDLGLQRYLAKFMQYTGQFGRLLESNNSNSFIGCTDQNAFVSTTSLEAANIMYSQLWSNDNESIVLENLDNDSKYDDFITWLNKTNLSNTISLLIKDYLDFGFGFVYIEETTDAPYVRFKLMNPLSVAWLEYDDAYFFCSKYFNKTKKYYDFYIDVITKDGSYRVHSDGRKTKTDLKYDSVVAIKPDNMNDISGVGLNLLPTIEDLESSVKAYRLHMALHIKPPIAVNSHSLPEDGDIDQSPNGVTYISEQYGSGATMNPTAMILDKYHNILNDVQTYLQLQRTDIQKAYRLDILESQDKTGAIQLLRSQLYYIFMPKLVKAVVGIYKRKMKIDLGNKWVLKFDTLANNASTASKANNMTEFLNMVGMVEKIAGGSGLKLNPSKIIEEIGRILKIDPYVLFTEQELTQMMQEIAAQKKQQQQAPPQQQPRAQQAPPPPLGQ